MTALTMQDALARLADYWREQGCLTVQPMNTEVGAGTLNPATFLRVLGPEPWKVAYVEPSVRPDDARYGENPNRLQTHTQFQVILKPEPGNAQELYLGSLVALGVDVAAHDIRFVEDNWAQPAVGAWGLGWEVWLDGLEITQFTYFQQVGGLNLDPVPVEITYGIERILMAQQNVTHFKDIAYAPGVSYGEVFGQGEYEMSRFYLDDADVDTARALLGHFADEAQRMIDAGLPVPAHTLILKCSQAFNILDSRGAVSTSDRAAEFARMRRMSGEVAKLWVQRRAELDHPLGVAPTAPLAAAPAATGHAIPTTTSSAAPGPQTLVFEIGVEEMPPAEARAARDWLAQTVTDKLAGTRLAHGAVYALATPRRLVVTVEGVAAVEEDATRTVKGPKVSAAYKPDGTVTPAAAGFARSQGVAVEDLVKVDIAGTEHLAVVKDEPGRTAPVVLADLLGEVVTGLRGSRNMRWLDPSLSFTRPVRWLLALWGTEVVPVVVSTLAADRLTRVHRTSAEPTLAITSADSYSEQLAATGIVLNPDARWELITKGALALAASVGGTVDLAAEAALLDQICYLIEQPTPLLGSFDPSYLDLPEEILTAVMRKHQRYLPVRAADGTLLPHFVVVANGAIDPDLVRAGNEGVLRARYEDAAFFHRADLGTPIADMAAKLSRLTFTDKLGSMADRSARIRALAGVLADTVGLTGEDRATLDRAGELVLFDLGSQMVTEMTSLAGVMAREYAAAAGESPAVARALFEAELPRQAGDVLPTGVPGAILSLAARLDMLTGLAATVGLPTGSSDPYALRRAVLGAVSVHRAQPAVGGLSLAGALAAAARLQPVDVTVLDALGEFVTRRFEQQLLDEGYPVDRVRAVLPHADRPHHAELVLGQLTAVAGEESFLRLAAALQRARRIVPAGTPTAYDPALLTEPAEQLLHDTLGKVHADLTPGVDLAGLVAATTSAGLPDAVDRFFDDILVMAEDPALRAARTGIVAAVAALGDGHLDWVELRVAR
ncbi:glycine--tRNA ligase [Longispora sp. K20-0274]|uniref:glycine--tRNA ligase n=1 Tax=Longispora sp. K20-0274 TaxID=3088255 RepID=UPI00399B6F71